MKRYSLTPRMGTLMTLSLFLPMMDSSATRSTMLSRIDSRTFWRWRWRSPALRSERNESDWEYGRNIEDAAAIVLPRASTLPAGREQRTGAGLPAQRTSAVAPSPVLGP